MLRLLATSGFFVLALTGAAMPQTTPAAPTAGRAAFAERGATFALRGAYHAIADAEARGATAYLDAAKTHYRGALARLQRHDAGAASEAMAAAALAHASEAEHPVPAPRDIPAPPAMTADAGPRPMMPRPPMEHTQMAMGVPGAAAMQHGLQMMHRSRGMHRGHGMHERFDATRLAADAKLANTSEARDLAQKALDADIARTHAAFNGNKDEALRDGHVASALAMAVRSLALADHPRTFRRPMAPGSGSMQRAGS
jgi:hypothetical protein